MQLVYDKGAYINCKIARFLKYPKISPRGGPSITTHYTGYFTNVNLHALVITKYITLFYTSGESIYIWNNYMRPIHNIVPLYDYKTRKYIILLAGNRYRGPSWDRWQSVKAPNGKLYTVSVNEIERLKFRLDVYSWHQDKIIYSITSTSDTMPFHTGAQVEYIMGNSFVVICRKIEDKVYIDVVNLITENFERISYSVKDYLLDAIRNHPSIEPDIAKLYESNVIQNYEKYNVKWDEKNQEQVLAKNNDQLVFFKKVKLYFGTEAHWSEVRFKNALVILLSFDNNTLDVQFLTGQRIILYRDKTYRLHVPDNLLLMHKKYTIDSLYDISNSYPYYISEVSDNYIFIGNYAYKLASDDDNYYVMDKNPRKIIRASGFNFRIMAGKWLPDTNCIVKVEKVHLWPKSDFGVLTVFRREEEPGHEEDEYLEILEVLDLNKVYQLYNNNEVSQSSYVDVSDCVYKIIVQRIIDEAIRIIKDKYYKGYNIRFIHCTYQKSLSEHSATLYIIAILEINFVHNFRRHDRILIIYDLRKRNRKSLKVVLMSSHETIRDLYDRLDIRSKSLRILANYVYSKMNFLMLSSCVLYNLLPGNTYLVEYGGDIIIYNDCKNLKAIDIKFNRTSQFQFRVELVGTFFERKHYIIDDIIVKYEFTSRKDGRLYEYYFVIVMSDLLLTKPIPIVPREEYLNLGIL